MISPVSAVALRSATLLRPGTLRNAANRLPPIVHTGISITPLRTHLGTPHLFKWCPDYPLDRVFDKDKKFKKGIIYFLMFGLPFLFPFAYVEYCRNKEKILAYVQEKVKGKKDEDE